MINDVYQTTVVAQIDGVFLSNIFFVKQLTASSVTDDVIAAGNAIAEVLIPKLALGQSHDVVYDCLVAKRVFEITSCARVIQMNQIGQLTSDTSPANNAIKVRHYSGFGGKTSAGRYFIVGIPEEDVNRGRAEQGYLLTLGEFIDQLSEVFSHGANDYRIQHYSPKLDVYSDILKGSAWPIITKQRNRTPALCPVF